MYNQSELILMLKIPILRGLYYIDYVLNKEINTKV